MTMESPRPSRTTRFFFWWADHASIQLATVIVVSVLAIIGYINPDLVTGPIRSAWDQLVFDDAKETSTADGQQVESFLTSNQAPPPDVEPFRVAGGESVLLISVGDGDSDEDVFDPENLQAIRKIVEDLNDLPQVSSTLWVDDIPEFNLFGLAGTLVPSPNASERQIKESRQRVLDNPLAVGQLISQDAKTLLVYINFDWFFVRSNEDTTSGLRQCAENAAASVPGSNLQFKVTGFVPLRLMLANNHVTDSRKYQLIGYSIMLISALVLFRGLSAVVIVAVAPALGVFWTIGILGFFDLQDNPFNDIIVPVLISLVGLTDAVHLMVEIRQQRANGLPTIEAARQGVARVGMACLLTSVTTAIGFLSLMTAHHDIVREFGCCCVIGILMTFISVLTAIPLGCRSPLGKRLHVGIGKSMIDSQLRRIGPVVDWVIRRDRPVAWFAMIATFVLAMISLQLTPDEKRFSGLSDSGEAAQGLRQLDDALGGLEFGYVNVNWYSDAAEAELLPFLAAVDEILKSEPLMGSPLGVHQLLKALPGEGSPDERMSLLELLPAELKRAFYSPENRHASFHFRIKDLGIAAYSKPFERVEEKLKRLSDSNPNFTATLGGDAIWRWKNVFQIVSDLAKSLGTASIVIWIVLTFVYRSIRIGLISIIPNLFPLAATASMLALTGQHLEMVTVCVFTICVGIAVDDTIHFLTRYSEEKRLGGDESDIIRRAFTGVGSALLMTTIVLVAGLASAIMGDSRDARIFGVMGCITLATALFADIVLLPAMLSRYARTTTYASGPATGSSSD